MKKILIRQITFTAITIIAVLINGGAKTIYSIDFDPIVVYGWFDGLFHGVIILVAFIFSLFSDDITIYAINNNGSWYNFGFIIGTLLSFYDIILELHKSLVHLYIFIETRYGKTNFSKQ